MGFDAFEQPAMVIESEIATILVHWHPIKFRRTRQVVYIYQGRFDGQSPVGDIVFAWFLQNIQSAWQKAKANLTICANSHSGTLAIRTKV